MRRQLEELLFERGCDLVLRAQQIAGWPRYRERIDDLAGLHTNETGGDSQLTSRALKCALDRELNPLKLAELRDRTFALARIN